MKKLSEFKRRLIARRGVACDKSSVKKTSFFLTALRSLYTVFLCVCTMLLVFFVAKGGWLQTDMQTLLPQQQQWSQFQIQADKIQEQQLNRQVVSLLGHSDPQQAFALAENIASQWQSSGLFAQINSKTQPNLTALQQEIKQLRLAVLPFEVRKRLLLEPSVYFQQYAQQIINPFEQTHLLPLDQDWLGLGRFVLPQSQILPHIQWDSNSGMLYVTQQNKTWVLLRGELKQSDLISTNTELIDLIEQNKQTVEKSEGRFLTAGSALFAAVAKQQAEKESTLMSVTGITLTLLLLFFVFRILRVLWLFLPILFGMLTAVTATIAYFGQIHILTLVIGTSLVGVLIDFPLHWLASSLFNSNWNGARAMRRLRRTFLISLTVTLLGYGLLWFTVLPVLKQTALFSAVALISAILCTLLFLPLFFGKVRGVYRENFFQFTFSIPYLISAPTKRAVVFLLVFFVAIGIYRSEWRDDILQWVSMPPEMVEQVKEIGELTGIDLGSRYFLLVAENDQQLLQKDKRLSLELDALHQEYQSLSQWILTESEQQQFIRQLATNIQQTDYRSLIDIGVPPQAVEEELRRLQNQPAVSLQTALQTNLAQGWKTLYLGELEKGKVAGLVKTVNVKNVEALQSLANQQDIFWQDKRAQLNQSFQQTRNQAAWLKVLSFALAGILLWRLFGVKSAVKILLIPFAAIIITVALFGWLNMPISLFTMFGLLLVSAIGIDYTAYMHSARESVYNKRIAVLLAAATTVISFILLGLSSTPAVASFGLSVSIGVAVCVLITFKFLR